MIIYIGWRLGFEATKELVDTSIDPEDIKILHSALEDIKGVKECPYSQNKKNWP